MTAHVTRRQTYIDAILARRHFAQCSCGWQGSSCIDQDVADDEATEHREENVTDDDDDDTCPTCGLDNSRRPICLYDEGDCPGDCFTLCACPPTRATASTPTSSAPRAR